jgi:pimeloyl-ACP methyl ester carboxylesterase
MPKHEPADHLAWRTIRVDGRRVNYGVAGHGLPVLFIHGWALGSHAYKRSLKRLVRLSCRVFAPALPEFGGSTGLPEDRSNLAGYAQWASAFLEAVGVDEPALVVGHSFGGAVAARLAHDFPDRVAHLVLINSVGGGAWTDDRTMAERPLWDWAVTFSRDILTGSRVRDTFRAIVEDALPNFVHNPFGVWRVAGMARRVDVTKELAAIRAEGVPVTVVWSEDDLIVPTASFRAICRALGVDGHVVPGRHSWLLADPGAFAGVMVRAVTAASAARAARAGLEGRVVPIFAAGRRRAANE